MEAVYLNVSELPAPEPFHRILAVLSKLKENQYLVAHHRKEPKLIYQPLAELGFEVHVRGGSEAAFEIIIWRSGTQCPIALD